MKRNPAFEKKLPTLCGTTLFGAILFLLLLCYFPARSQECAFNHLSMKDGLASNQVNCLWQDKKGFLWIGTGNGLQRYDGYHFFSPYYGNGANSLPRLPVNQIIADTVGRMWIRMGKTMGIFDPATLRFRPVTVAANTPIPDANEYYLRKDSKGNIFLVVHRHGWLYFDPASFSFREDKIPFVIPRSFELTDVWDDAQNGYWWIIGRQGLAMYDSKTKQLYNYAHNPINHPLLKDRRLTKKVFTFYIDKQRRYWLISRAMPEDKTIFYCFDEHTQTYKKDTAGLSAMGQGYFELHSFTELADTTLIYGLNCLGIRINGQFIPMHNYNHHHNSHFEVEFNIVNAALLDREKILWIATDDGLYCSTSFTSSSMHLMLGQKQGWSVFTSLLEPQAGSLWVGTWPRGVLPRGAKDLSKQENGLYKNVPPDTNYKLTRHMYQHSRSGNIWIGCQKGRLIIYDTAKDRSSFIHPAVFNEKNIRQIAEDTNGNLWFGTQNGLLVKWRKGATLHDSSFHLLQQLPSDVLRLYTDKQGLLWIALSGNGVMVINPVTGQLVKHYNSTNSNEKLYGNHIRDIVQLNDSMYAFAADVLELLNIRTGAIIRAGNYNQWPVGPVLTMQTDNDNQLWLSTPNGIYKYNYARQFFIRYSQWDGLITVHNTSYQMETSLKLRNGRIVFAGNQNLVSFDPREYRLTGIPPDVSIVGFKLFNDYLPVDSLLQLQKVQLNYTQHSITLEFAAPGFTRIDKLSYYYKLEGADDDWRRVEGPLQVNFTLLPPGKYKFLVRAGNEEGHFSRITSLPITILPPFWQTGWFYSLVLLLTTTLLYYLYRLRINRLLHVEKIRSRLARDLHDDMGSTLSTINILSNMAAKKVTTDQEASRDYMTRISNNSSRIMEAMDDIVWSISPANDSMRKITARMKEFAGNLLEASDIEYSFQVDDVVKEMSFDMEWRREIFLVFKEAITNIVKYAHCTQVHIKLQKQKGHLVMTIADNGRGFSQDTESSSLRGNGIKNMRKRAAAMNSSLEITSVPHTGTSVTLKVPLA